MHPLPRALEEAHVDLPKVVLREFPRQPFESNQRADRLRPHRRDQLVERGSSARVPFELGATENRDREQVWLACQDLCHHGPA